jgi:MFS family permease
MKQGTEKIMGVDRNVFFLGITSLFNDFSSEMLFSVFPAFFIVVLKAGAASLGLVEGISEGCSNLTKIYSGHLSDKLRKRKILVVSGYTLSVMTRPLYLAVSQVPSAFSLRFIDRIGKGLRDAPRDALISLSSPAQQMGRSFGYHRAMDTLGAIIGPLLAYGILKNFPDGFHLIFVLSFGIGIIALLSLLFVNEISQMILPEIVRVDSFGAFSIAFKRYLLSIFILSAGSLPIAVLLLKPQSIGLTAYSVPLFYTIYNLSYAAVSMTAGRLSDKHGTRGLIIAGYLILNLSYIAFYFSSSVPTLVVSFLILGLFPAFTDGVQRAHAAKLTAEEQRGRAYGLLNAVSGIGVMAAGIGGGYIWQFFGSTCALLVAEILVTLGLVLFIAGK